MARLTGPTKLQSNQSQENKYSTLFESKLLEMHKIGMTLSQIKEYTLSPGKNIDIKNDPLSEAFILKITRNLSLEDREKVLNNLIDSGILK